MRVHHRKTYVIFFALVTTWFCCACLSWAQATRPANPNIVYILADDLGYGDVGALNKNGKIKTPHLDQLASEGMAFTDAHSGSAVCTPTRYGILTGRYCWRTHLRHGVLWGYSPPLINTGRLTVAAMLKQQNYDTGAIGKWHLGWDWSYAGGGKKDQKVDFSRPFRNGPTTLGFDSFFGIPASLDMFPYCFIANDRTVGLPTATKSLWKDRLGPAVPDFEAVDVLPTLTAKAMDFVSDHGKTDKPFFLYFALNCAAYSDRPQQRIRRKERDQQVRRFCNGDRLGGWPGDGCCGSGRQGARYAGHLHQRQRLFAGG